ncbi:MAG: hypothetical protein JWO28_2469, partial [Hyphomicrobiales bacterium]|nr:hypothetical protein [Hyphomicrobiales bacterium]
MMHRNSHVRQARLRAIIRLTLPIRRVLDFESFLNPATPAQLNFERGAA